MVQIIPHNPDFGDKLFEVLSNAGTQFGNALAQRYAKKSLNNLLNPNQNQSSVNNSQESGDNQGAAPARQLPSQGGIDPSQILQIHDLAEKAYGKDAANLLSHITLEQQKQNQKVQAQKDLQNSARQNAIVQKRQETNLKDRESYQNQLTDLEVGFNAQKAGNVGAYSLDTLANTIPGLEGLKSPYANIVQSTAKNGIVDSLSKLSGVKSKWLEELNLQALPGLEKSPEGNAALYTQAIAMTRAKLKKVDIEEQLISEYEKSGVTPPSNIDQIADKLVQPFARELQQKAEYDTRVLYEKWRGERDLLNIENVPQGTYLTTQKRDALMKKYGNDAEKVLKLVKSRGYVIPPKRFLEEGSDVNGEQ